jgi:hypothetical protein
MRIRLIRLIIPACVIASLFLFPTARLIIGRLFAFLFGALLFAAAIAATIGILSGSPTLASAPNRPLLKLACLALWLSVGVILGAIVYPSWAMMIAATLIGLVAYSLIIFWWAKTMPMVEKSRSSTTTDVRT